MQFFLKKVKSIDNARVTTATVITTGASPSNRGSNSGKENEDKRRSLQLSARPSALRAELRQALDLFYGDAIPEDNSTGGTGERERKFSLRPEASTPVQGGMSTIESFQKLAYFAVRIQRGFRLREAMFRTFGADMFVDGSGFKAPHGKLLFEGAASVPRPFIVVADSSTAPLLAQFISKFWCASAAAVAGRGWRGLAAGVTGSGWARLT